MGRLEEIEAAGAQLVFVDNGRADQAARFAEKEVPGATLLTDPSLESYRALGLPRGVRATLGPGSTLAAVSAAVRGHRQTRIEGDAWQQAGLLVLGPGGRILFLQRNRDAGDRPDLDGALRALGAERRRAARRRSEVG